MLSGSQWRRIFVHMLLEVGLATNRVCDSSVMTPAYLFV